ncbi:MAG: polysaccharide deacetylase family protein [Deltaproteobacteria bacterium]|nr:polysaccharide deacetylase family protein [Deltaproteobacteria bacterium]
MLREYYRSVVRPVLRKANHFRNLYQDRSCKIIVLIYHRVLPCEKSSFMDMVVPFHTFENQIDSILQQGPIISFQDYLEQSRGLKEVPSLQFILTFDDGYVDGIKYIAPFLKKRGVSGVFFICTDSMGRNKPLWDWYIMNKFKDQLLPQKIMRILYQYKALSEEERLERINRDFSIDFSKTNDADRCLNWSEVVELTRDHFEVGSHSKSHSSLAFLHPNLAHEEISESKRMIEEQTNKECRLFAFPYGGPEDWNNDLIQHVFHTGYQGCFTNIHGYNRFEENNLVFKRVIMTPSTDVRYLLG